jgi:hypothetical protein
MKHTNLFSKEDQALKLKYALERFSIFNSCYGNLKVLGLFIPIYTAMKLKDPQAIDGSAMQIAMNGLI